MGLNVKNPGFPMTNAPSHATSVEPSPIAVVDPSNAASIPPTDEVLTSLAAMDYSVE